MKVELITAFQWTCPECGNLNYESARDACFNAEDRREFKAAMGDDVEPVLAPLSVGCPKCLREFETENPFDMGIEE